MALCETATRMKIQQHLLAAPPRVKPRDTPPEVQPIARRTRYHKQNTQPPISLYKGLVTTIPHGHALPSVPTIFRQGPTIPLVQSCYSPSHISPQI